MATELADLPCSNPRPSMNLVLRLDQAPRLIRLRQGREIGDKVGLKIVRLKPGKEKPILNRHHWIFSGAVAELPAFQNGEILAVVSHSGERLGSAYFNRKASIIGRMVAWGDKDPELSIQEAIHQAISLRKKLFDAKTTAYRLINAEGDCLPGLIVDKYGDYLVLQISTLGMEHQKKRILDTLQRILTPQGMYEKSIMSIRKEEGLPEIEQELKGPVPKSIHVLENDLNFAVSPQEGQKTGFFLDQREMRQYVRGIASNTRMLNCFAYTGGFTVYALAGGAIRVDSVDISAAALEGARKNCALNNFSAEKTAFFPEDAFEFLRKSPLNYDLILLDPPAFAKRAKDVVAACRGYKDINRLALQKMPSGSTLITCSCSHFVDEKLFQQVLFQAAAEANRNVRILSRHRQAADHPVNLCHPEGEYLKSLVLYVE